MYLSKRNQVYYLWYIDHRGKKCKVSTGSSSKREAYEFLRTFREEKKEEPNKRLSLMQLEQEIMNYVNGTYAPGTAKLYQSAWNIFLILVGDLGISEVNMFHADKFKVVRLKTVSPVTVNMQLRTLRASFGMPIRWGFLTKNPLSGMSLASVLEKAPEYFTIEEFESFLSLIDKKWFRDMVTFAASTGARQAEVLNLRWDDIDLSRKVVRIQSSATFKTKSGKMRVLPLGGGVSTLLDERSKEGKTEYVFTLNGKKIG
jgi:integrase